MNTEYCMIHTCKQCKFKCQEYIEEERAETERKKAIEIKQIKETFENEQR